MSKSKAKVIKANKGLQMKVGTGEVDAETIKKAQQVIDENKVEFAPIAKPQMDNLRNAIDGAGEADEAVNLEAITLPIMNLKANAATFNYPLISDLAGTVLTFIEHVKKVDDEVLVIVDNLHKTLTIAIAQKITDVKNPLGAELLKEFKDVCKRYMDKRL